MLLVYIAPFGILSVKQCTLTVTQCTLSYRKTHVLYRNINLYSLIKTLLPYTSENIKSFFQVHMTF